MAAISAKVSATLWLRLRRLKLSVTPMLATTRRAPTARARSIPWRLGTSTLTRWSTRRPRAATNCAISSAASAIFGTQRGDTNEVTSTWSTSVSSRRSTSSSLALVGSSRSRF